MTRSRPLRESRGPQRSMIAIFTKPPRVDEQRSNAIENAGDRHIAATFRFLKFQLSGNNSVGFGNLTSPATGRENLRREGSSRRRVSPGINAKGNAAYTRCSTTNRVRVQWQIPRSIVYRFTRPTWIRGERKGKEAETSFVDSRKREREQ